MDGLFLSRWLQLKLNLVPISQSSPGNLTTTTTADVTLYTRRGEFTLRSGEVLQDLPDVSGHVIVRQPIGTQPPLLDGRPLRQIEPGRFLTDLVLIGDSGYHEVHSYASFHSPAIVFGFCTKRATERITLVREMMEFVGNLGETPEQAFLLGALGDEYRRVPGVVLGWLTERLHQLVIVLTEISCRPILENRSLTKTQPFAANVSVALTRQFIRANPHLVSRRENGVLWVAGKRYSPEFAINSVIEPNENRLEHRQAVEFMTVLVREINLLREKFKHLRYEPMLASGSSALTGLLRSPFWKRVVPNRDSTTLNAKKTVLQAQDSRYGQVFSLLQEFRVLRTYEPADDDLRTILEGAPRIFQAFACYAIADALGMKLVGSRINDRKNKASFVSEKASLYFDVVPPVHVLTSWRANSAKPDFSRPDIVIADRDKGIAVVDAKFKDYNDDGNMESDLREMQVYHDSFRIEKSAIVTPFRTSLDVARDDRLIRVLPLPPVPFTHLGQLRSHILNGLAAVFNQNNG